MKKAFALAMALAATLATAALAADRRETRTVGDFIAVGVSAPVTVHVTQAAGKDLELQGDASLLADLETVVERATLRIRLREGAAQRRWNRKVEVRVSAPRIEALSVAGSGDISAPSITGESLTVSIAGSGDVRVGGKVSGLTASIAGSGDLRAGELEAERVRVSIAGSGDATVRAREALSASVAGSGDVRYYGDPAVTRNVMGSGSIRKAGGAAS